MNNEDRIAVLLARKTEIDRMEEGQFIERQRWLTEAVELLLQISFISPDETRTKPDERLL